MVLMDDGGDRASQVRSRVVVTVLVYEGLGSWPDSLDDGGTGAPYCCVGTQGGGASCLVDFGRTARYQLLS